ncbi:MAG: type IX secretion system sortase PorU [Paludibacteraceae bacterium]
MKIRILSFLFFCIIFLTLNAENTITATYQLKWKGIDVWTTDKSTKSVIAFDNAAYPEGAMPYFVKGFDCGKNTRFNVSLTNVSFTPMTDAKELELIQGKQIPTEVEIKTYKQSERGNYRMLVQLFPFIQQEGKILKLQKFDLNVEKIQDASKVIAAENGIHSYTTTSALANGKFVKIKLSESGIYKLTYETLNSMGINPANVRVFGYGGAQLNQSFLKPKLDDLPEMPIYMNKGADGVFNAGDYILFYGQGVNSWEYDTARKMFTHTLNTYSTYGYYFVTSDAGVGKRIEDKTVTVPAEVQVADVDQFIDYQLHEKESYNIISSGKVFYGEPFNDVLTYGFTFQFPNAVKTPTAKARVDVMAFSSLVSNYTVQLNNSSTNQYISVSAIASGSIYELGKAANAIFSFKPDNDIQTLKLTFVKPDGTSRGYLNYIEMNVRRQLIMTDNVMFFRNVDSLYSANYSNYRLSGANPNIQVWDITSPVNMKRMVTSYSNGLIEFKDSNETVKQYVAIDPTAGSSFAQPIVEGVVPNQNLHGMESAELVILAHPRFLTQANQLADAHRTKDNMKVNVVTTEQVYNEFSSGTPDATAYRWVMKMFYDRALSSGIKANLPKYLLLFGRGSFDNRDLLTVSSESLVLTYQADESLHAVDSYITDDYFGLLDDGEATNIKGDLMDVGVGRFPVLTEQQASDVVNKTIGYMNNTQKSIWKNQLCFVGDDGGDNNGNIHMFQADSIARMIYRANNGIQLNKIYLDAYKQEKNASGESYPLAKAKLNNLIHSGVFMLNYTGHAGPTGWANEQILTTYDVKQLYNDKLPIWVAATCDFVVIDGKNLSAGEHVLLNPTGGGIGIFSAARTVYSANNFTLNKPFSCSLFNKTNGQYVRLGDASRIAKNELSKSGDSNKLSYVLLADPALKLNYPDEFSVVTSMINDKQISGNDTLKALSVDSIKGYIADSEGNLVSDYNGILEINIYDKNQKITTLNNHADGFLVYDDRPNILYSGKANIKNGVFSFKFMIPKDIRYNYGTGRINYYASESTSNREAQGYFEDFVVGGTSKNFDINDNEGPNLSAYLNYSGFKSGDKVNETPLFVANVEDKNGINTVGSGIGHDLRLVIDSDPALSYTLNDGFSAHTDSYTQGTVQYKIPTLSEGKHTLTFYAWDLLNNSSSITLDFEVINGLTPNIFEVSCYPNPANISTKFVVVNDRPQTVLETTVDVYDLVGRKIWSKSQSSVENLNWDLTDFGGKKVQRGIYLYKVSIKTTNSKLTSKTNKIIVTSLQ